MGCWTRTLAVQHHVQLSPHAERVAYSSLHGVLRKQVVCPKCGLTAQSTATLIQRRLYARQSVRVIANVRAQLCVARAALVNGKMIAASASSRQTEEARGSSFTFRPFPSAVTGHRSAALSLMSLSRTTRDVRRPSLRSLLPIPREREVRGKTPSSRRWEQYLSCASAVTWHMCVCRIRTAQYQPASTRSSRLEMHCGSTPSFSANQPNRRARV